SLIESERGGFFVTATTKTSPTQRELADKAAKLKVTGKRHPRPSHDPAAVAPKSDAAPPSHQLKPIHELAQPPPGARLLSKQEVMARVKLSYPSIWQRMN